MIEGIWPSREDRMENIMVLTVADDLEKLLRAVLDGVDRHAQMTGSESLKLFVGAGRREKFNILYGQNNKIAGYIHP